MKLEELSTKNKNYINGKIAYLIDDFIRKNRVWSEEQIFENVIKTISKILESGQHKVYYDKSWDSKDADSWMLTIEGKILIKNRVESKLKNYKTIAEKISPILERVKFGFKKVEHLDFEISYGRKYGIARMSKNELNNLKAKPWTVEHFENQLIQNYNVNLNQLYANLCTSHLEILFKDYWIKNFYSKKSNPVLIPEFAGPGWRFYYKKDQNGNIYRNEEDTSKVPSRVRSVNFRFDFLILNSLKNKGIIIELDGFNYHKEKNDQIKDSIKRNVAAEIGLPIKVFTSDRIIDDIDNCFLEISDYMNI
ncbi:MAG: hypothetical protein ACEPOW_14070 [Bacteroidales bacterium]